MGELESNELIMITLINTKQIIHVSGPMDETSFSACDKLILVLRQKGDLTTRYPQIMWYNRLPMKLLTCTCLLTKFQPRILWGKSIHQWGNFEVI